MNMPPCFYRVSAKAAIVVNGKLLVVKEDSSKWDLPGGGIEHHELIEDALKREVFEEVGATVTSIDTESLKAWATFDEIAQRPLVFLAYKVSVDEAPKEGVLGNITIAYVSKEHLAAIELEDHHLPFCNIFMSFV